MGCGLVPWASVLCELMKPDPCQASACEIQKCLQANKYQEEACQSAFRQMERCCTKWKDQSLSCSGFKSKNRPSDPVPVNPVKPDTVDVTQHANL